MHMGQLKFIFDKSKKIKQYATYSDIRKIITFQPKHQPASDFHENHSQENYSFENYKSKTHSNTDYSVDTYNDKFYHWIEHICIPISCLDEVDKVYIREIRKIIYTAVNGIPVEQVCMAKKIFVSRVKAINLIGKDKLMKYYDQNKLPLTCVE